MDDAVLNAGALNLSAGHHLPRRASHDYEDLSKLAALAKEGASNSEILPWWHAVGSTNVYMPAFVRRSLDSAGVRVRGREPCELLGAKPANRNFARDTHANVTRFELLQERHYDPEASAKHGVVWELATNAPAWVERVSFSVGHNYCRVLPEAGSQSSNGRVHEAPSIYRQLHGITVLLSEAHGNSNVGHAGTDHLFLAHVLSRRHEKGAMPVRLVVTDDTGGAPLKQAYEYRRTALRALTAGLVDPSAIVDRREKWDEAICSDLVLQKAHQWTGDWRSAAFFRHQAWSFCGVPPATTADTVFIEQHGAGKREWSAPTLAFMRADLRRRGWARGLTVVSRVLAGLSFCEQVRLFARARVFIAHHGAAVWANSVFQPPGSILVEVFPQYEEESYSKHVLVEPIGDAGSLDMAKAIGRHYVGSRSAFLLDIDEAAKPIEGITRYLTSRAKLGVNRTRWHLAMDLVASMLRGDAAISAAAPPLSQPAKRWWEASWSWLG